MSCKYYDFGLNSYRKMNVSRFSHINALGIKLDLEVGQGQPRFIICANLVGPHIPNATKSQGFWPFGSREENI